MCFLSLSFLLVACSCVQAIDGILGTTIYVTGNEGGQQQWLTSQNGTFSAGFSSLSNATVPLFSFSIWYTSVPSTIVWRAMSNDTGGAPVGLLKGDQLVFQTDGRLVLTSNAAGIVWGTTTQTLGVTKASLLENGNLVLLGSNGPVWQSFERPTDTLLPEQQLTGAGRLVSSNRKYYLSMDSTRVALYYQGYWLEPYWTIENDNSSSLVPPRLTFNTSGVVSFFDGNGTSWKNPTKVYDTAQRYALDFPLQIPRRLVLEDDGNLRIYSLAVNSTTWSITYQAILQECEIFGKCGRFGICTYRPTATCVCPPGFHPTNASDATQDCVYNTPLPKCPAGSNFTVPNSTKLIRLARVDFQYNDYNSHPLPTPISEDDCMQRCLRECMCLGAAYQILGSGMCWLKGLDPAGLFNGIQSLDINNVFFLKVSSKEPVEGPLSSNVYVTNVNATVVPGFQWRLVHRSFFEDTARVSLLICTMLLSFALVSISGYSWCTQRARQRARIKAIEFEMVSSTRFSYQELQSFTNNFCEKLGSGGFGTVFKGALPDGTPVAVKELEVAMHAEQQFHAEVNTLGKIHHINLVRLLGYCCEGSKRLLVYEYMSEGSLEKRLFVNDNEHFFNWSSRFNIALGVARGITYLHDECHQCILHCDIKPQNILLDEKFIPKVADFGLSKLVKRERGTSVTTVRGTRGYLAPEWIGNLPITTKVDVFSFGMVLLEIIGGRDKYLMTSSVLNSETNRWNFPDWAYNRYEAGELKLIPDKKLGDEVDLAQLRTMLKVAFWCIQYDANARPSMNKVVQMLEDNVLVPEPPLPTRVSDSTIFGTWNSSDT